MSHVHVVLVLQSQCEHYSSNPGTLPAVASVDSLPAKKPLKPHSETEKNGMHGQHKVCVVQACLE